MPPPDPSEYKPRRSARLHVLAIALVGCATVAVAALLFPADSPRAAGDEASANPAVSPPPGSSPGAVANGDISNFGSATPTDKFVQSFQQQVSQQLQSALAQSAQQQEEHLREFEQQQKDLSDQVQAIRQSVESTQQSSREAANGRDAMPDADGEPPRVNSRHAVASEMAPEQRGDGAPAPSLLGALGASVEDPRAIPVSYASGSRPGRPGEPNIAPHGFVEGRMLNGVVAVLGGPDRESIVALHGSYQSANGFSTDLDGCFALVQGRPEIAAGRIDFKLSRLTCNFPDGASRTWDAAGWLVDADGIRGVRAAIVENVGRKALAAAAGGAIGGVGQRLSQEQYQINTISSGAGTLGSGSSSTFIGSTGVDAAGGAATGAANAIGQAINEYYNLFTPSLQVGGGTPVTVVLANDLRLPPSGKDITQTHLAAP